METYIAALDQGTTTSRAILFNSRGEIVSKAQYPFRQIFPQPGWVEHDPMEIWATTVRALSEAVDAAHIDPKAIAGIGITNPVGPPDRTAGVQCHCVAVPSDGGDLRPAEGRRPWRNGDGKDRPADRRLFFRYEAEVDHGSRSRRPPAGGAGRAVRRNGGQLAYLEPDRREGPCDGLFQRQPHHAVQYPYPAMGPGALCRAGHPHGPAAGAEVQQRGLRPSGFRLAGIGGSGGHPGVRQRGRSAVRPVRTGLLYSRSGEEHLRDRLLYPDERGRYAGAVP